MFTVTAVLVHTDPTLVDLTISGDTLETTPQHPFYVDGKGWVNAGDLVVGDRIRRADGSDGTVQAVKVVQRQQVMYNLTVDVAHTFFVGDKHWLVHNTEPPCTPSELQLAQQAVDTQKDLGVVPKGTTVAAVRDTNQIVKTISGWSADVAQRFGDNVERFLNTYIYAEELQLKGLYTLRGAQFDADGFIGSRFVSHAEKKMVVLMPDRPIAVSQSLCGQGDCFAFFRAVAKDRGVTQILAAPNLVYIFRSNGAVMGLSHSNGIIDLASETILREQLFP